MLEKRKRRATCKKGIKFKNKMAPQNNKPIKQRKYL